MNSIELRLARVLLNKALNFPCPQLIPRSGDDGKRMNCFTIYIDKLSRPYLLVRNISGDYLDCLEWSGAAFDKAISIKLNDIDVKDIAITHFYGQSEIQYSGLWDFFLGRMLFFPYFKIHTVRALTEVDQYFFNKKKLYTRQRIELLQFLVQRHLDGEPILGSIGLMTELYSIKWVLHPESRSQLERVTFYLDSLVDTGELRRNDYKYELTGLALKSIETYEEQERKHTENVKVQRRMFWLTLAIVLLTGAQAGLYKVPTLLDMSDWLSSDSVSVDSSPSITKKP